MKLVHGLVLLLLTGNLLARDAEQYLPPDADLDPAIPSPESVLGWNVADWHVSHDKLVHYMQALAAASPRVSIKEIGRTHEQRPLLQLAISSSDNQARLESLRQAHLDGDGPLVVWLGYSVHGDEPSGSNASMLAAYYLAASRSEYVRELLDGTIVLLDPSINPDGLDRFASWANQNAGALAVTDPVTRQRIQNWPSARTNHYWFDLNRDWLPLVHPESRARIIEFHRWLPHLLTDHHEQGGRNPGYFFQPGVRSRQNPLTPDENFELTRALAAYHAQAMDGVGQPYFTEDAYDDFYFGKGSTYPDINGSVGILFEQRAIRGQALDTSNGMETFEMAVANQLRMSLSSLKGAWEMRERFKAYQSGFHQTMLERAASRKFAAWIVGDDDDPARARAFLDVLELHQVEYRALGETVRAGDHEFQAGSAWVIPVKQKQFGLLEAMMEQRTSFEDNTFYDVSAWTLPLAYNLPFATLGRTPVTSVPLEASNGLPPDPASRAWLVPWNQLEAPVLLQKLLDAGARIRTSKKAFTAQTANGLTAFQPGTLVLQAGIQDKDKQEAMLALLGNAALSGLHIFGLESTMTPSGPDFGASHFPIVRPVKPIILGGMGVSSYDTGTLWHLLDLRLEMAVPVVEQQYFESVDLDEYSHLLLADGRFNKLGAAGKDRIIKWVEDGGILVTSGRASTWAEELCFEQSCPESEEEDSGGNPPQPRAYSDFAGDRARLVIGGAIAATVADLSHPMAFGLQRPELPFFRQGTTVLKPSSNAYATPVRYTNEPLMAGYIGEERLDAMRGQPALIAEKQGDGLVVRFANNPLFRGFWRGTERLLVNALFFGQIIQETSLPRVSAAPKPEPEKQ
ncbi:MAG: M14 family zinc carboxypeptidase [Xanthomonadales bacterium]|jgi:hypothetical protein|nr:M14 family zinc carboxypeptidase [Xanthomonadales bacterium]